jgi:tetratricopeptide (TPR) repeat protein
MQKNSSAKPKIALKTKITLIIFGLFLFLILLEVGLRLGGFVLLSIQEYRNIISIKQKGSYRIMCLGESTTQNQYPAFLEEILNQRNIGIKFSVIDRGMSAITTSLVLGELSSNINKYNPDMVVTMMGINDSKGYIHYKAATTSKITISFKSLRTYKLSRLLWLHILTKAKETGFYQPGKVRQGSKKIQTYLPRIRLEEAYAESISAEESLKKALELNPNNDRVYFALGWLYKDQGNFSQAEESFKKAIELNPKNDYAYAGLGWLYKDQGKFLQAEESFKKAVELNPKNDNAYAGLGRLYINQGKFLQAEDSLKKAVELNPKNDNAYAGLGRLYINQGKFSRAEDSYKKAIELNPKNDGAFGAISALYKEMGKPELAKEYAKKANRLRLEYYNSATVNNYRKLKEILDKRGIRLVCVQYPMRSVEPLKKIFEKDEGVIFVDNERIFKEAVRKANRKEYFIDMFGGDFGHCTSKGNRLLAENIANTIIKEVFHK